MTDLIPADLLVDTPPLTDDALAAYDAWVYEDMPGTPAAEAVRAWTIDGPNTCAWALAKYAAAQAVINDAAARRDAYVARIMDAYENEIRRAARDVQFFGGHLGRYAVAERERTGDKTKTVVTPNGKITTTRHAAKVIVDNEAAVLEWAEKHAPAAVKRSVLLTLMRDAVTLVEVPTSVVMSCGCVVDTGPGAVGPEATQAWAVGTGMLCMSCEQDALVGQWRTTRLVPVGADGIPVDGVDVEPEHVTAKVVAG